MLSVPEMHSHFRDLMKKLVLEGHVHPQAVLPGWFAVKVGSSEIGWSCPGMLEPVSFDRALEMTRRMRPKSPPQESPRAKTFLISRGWKQGGNAWAKLGVVRTLDEALLEESLFSLHRRWAKGLRRLAKTHWFPMNHLIRPTLSDEDQRKLRDGIHATSKRFLEALPRWTEAVAKAASGIHEFTASLSRESLSVDDTETDLSESHETINLTRPMSANTEPEVGHPCINCNTKMLRRRDQTHHYTSSGLPNVYVHGITLSDCEVCGEHEVTLPCVSVLHERISLELVTRILHSRTFTKEQWSFLSKCSAATSSWADSHVRGTTVLVDADADPIDCVWDGETWKIW